MTEKLNLGYDYGTITTLEFKTSIIEKGDGLEQRICNWNQPLLRFEIGERELNNSELNYFQSFLAARKGSFEPFLIRDWSDYSAKNQLLGSGNGVKTQYQLFKSYSLAGYTVNRQISNPVVNSLTVYVNGIKSISGFSLSNSGLLTFSTAPTGIITVDFSFDVLVRFEQDRIDYRFMAYDNFSGEKIFKIEKLSLIEVRENSNIGLSTPFLSLTHAIDLGYDYETIGGVEHSTQITSLFSGFEVRTQNWNNNVKGSWDVGNRTLNKSELDYLISLFRLCRGKFTSFVYQSHLTTLETLLQRVRFGEDRISFRFDAKDLSSDEVIFYLSGIALNNLIAPISGTFRVISRFTVIWRNSFNHKISRKMIGEVENTLNFYPQFLIIDYHDGNLGVNPGSYGNYNFWGFEQNFNTVLAHDNINYYSLGLNLLDSSVSPENLTQESFDVGNVENRNYYSVFAVDILSVTPI